MILISATGRDRPGMVAALTQKFFELNCNIEDATMTRLSGAFAMILVVHAPAVLSTQELEKELSTLRETHGLNLSCDDFDNTQQVAALAAPRWMLSAYGPDKTGLVARIAGVLASNKINITDLQTRVASSGALYVMLFEIELPQDFSEETLRTALDEATRELGVEYSLHEINEDAL